MDYPQVQIIQTTDVDIYSQSINTCVIMLEKSGWEVISIQNTVLHNHDNLIYIAFIVCCPKQNIF